MADWVIRLIDGGGYAGIFFLMLLETVFPPIPSEVIMPVAGLRAANGPMSLAGVVASGTAGALAGNLFWFLLAHRIGMARFRRFVDRHGRWLALDWGDVEKIERAFHRFGGAIVFFGRMTPNLRTFVSVPAGLLDMKLVRFLFWSTLGTAIWSGALAATGYGLGVRYGAIEGVVGPLSSVVIAGIVLLYLWRQLTWTRSHGRSKTETETD